MHYVLHVIHPADVDVSEYIEEKMNPFYEELEVPEYKDYYSEKEIASAQKWYAEKGFNDGDDPNDIIPFSWNSSTTYVDEKGAYRLSTWNPQGYWDWWVIGGRWDNYWETSEARKFFEGVVSTTGSVNTVSIGYALSLRNHGKYDWMDSGPYSYLTLDGEFIKRETYNKDGVGYEEGDPNSVFPPNPEYDYWGYLEEVEKQLDIAVTVVDYHC